MTSQKVSKTFLYSYGSDFLAPKFPTLLFLFVASFANH